MGAPLVVDEVVSQAGDVVATVSLYPSRRVEVTIVGAVYTDMTAEQKSALLTAVVKQLGERYGVTLFR